MKLTMETETALTRFVIMLALSLCIAGNPASAAVIYDFSLPANGSVGALNIQMTFADFLPEAGGQVFALSAPEVTAVTGAPPIDLANSVIGIDVNATSTLIGIQVVDLSANVMLFTVAYPGDFFVFSRTPTTTGTFGSTSGTVVSDFSLTTATPAGTLAVTPTQVVTPEPSTGLLLGLGFAVVAGMLRRRRRSA